MRKTLSIAFFLMGALWTTLASAACPTNNPQTIEAYIFGCPGAAPPYTGSIPLVSGSTTAPTSATTVISANTLLDTTSTQTAAGKTFTTPTINGGTLSGTIAGTPTYSGTPIFSGLSSGSCANAVALDSSNHLVTFACASGGTVTDTGSTSNGTVPSWTSTPHQLQGSGFQVSTTGAANSLVQLTSGGFIAAASIPVTGVTGGSCSSCDLTYGNDGRLTAASTKAVVYYGTITNGGSGNSYTLTLGASGPQNLPASLADGLEIHARVATGSGVNNGSSTLTVGSFAATTIYRQSDGGSNSPLVGGEIFAQATGNFAEYVFVYNSAVSGFINTVFPFGSAIYASSGTVNPTSSNWASSSEIVVIGSGVTIALPVSTSVPRNAALTIHGPVNPYAITPNGSDTIQGTTGAGITIIVIGDTIINSDGAGNIYASYTGNNHVSGSWIAGANLGANPVTIWTNNGDHNAFVTNVSCRVDVVEGGTAVFDVYSAPSGTALGSGTKLSTTAQCNANSSALTNQVMFAAAGVLSSVFTIVPGASVGIVGGASWSTTNGTGAVTVRFLQ